MKIISFSGMTPKIAEDAFVAPSVYIIGEVEIAAGASVWFNSVLRGDEGKIVVGKNSNVQDGCILHEGVIMEDLVTLGHRVLLHSCWVKRGALVGAGAIVWSGAEIGESSLVGVGAVVPRGMQVPPRTLVMGVPAKVIRELKEEEIQANLMAAHYYANLAQEYKKILGSAGI